MTHPRAGLLGVPISLLDGAGVQDEVVRTAGANGGYVTVCNVHSLVTAQHDAELREALIGSSVNCADGMPLVWGLRLLGHRNARRAYGQALMERLLGCVEGGVRRHYFLGSTETVQRRLLGTVTERFPGAEVVGRWVPPFSREVPALPPAVREEIRRGRTDVVWVGLGCPKQEKWMRRHWQALAPSVLIGVGAAFEYLAGTKPTPPAWVRSVGLEWLFRMVTEPRRLAWRYLSTNPQFLLRVGLQVWRQRRR